MARHDPPLVLSSEDRQELERFISQNKETNPRLAQRASIVLSCGSGKSVKDIADELSECRESVIKWRRRYVQSGIAGLSNHPRGKSMEGYGEDLIVRLREAVLTEPPDGRYWTAPMLAEHLGVPLRPVRRYLMKAGIHLSLLRAEREYSTGDTHEVFDGGPADPMMSEGSIESSVPLADGGPADPEAPSVADDSTASESTRTSGPTESEVPLAEGGPADPEAPSMADDSAAAEPTMASGPTEPEVPLADGGPADPEGLSAADGSATPNPSIVVEIPCSELKMLNGNAAAASADGECEDLFVVAVRLDKSRNILGTSSVLMQDAAVPVGKLDMNSVLGYLRSYKPFEGALTRALEEVSQGIAQNYIADGSQKKE